VYKCLDTGPPVLHGINASQTEIVSLYTTKFHRLSCCVTANPKPKIIWYKNGDILTFGTNRQDEQDGQTILLIDIRMSDRGNYTCIAKNDWGNLSHTFLVNVTCKYLLFINLFICFVICCVNLRKVECCFVPLAIFIKNNHATLLSIHDKL
jgi:hypothetical protein